MELGVLDLKNIKPLGYTNNGKFFLLGEGEVTIERFNEVVGGEGPGGIRYEFSVSHDEEP